MKRGNWCSCFPVNRRKNNLQQPCGHHWSHFRATYLPEFADKDINPWIDAWQLSNFGGSDFVDPVETNKELK